MTNLIDLNDDILAAILAVDNARHCCDEVHDQTEESRQILQTKLRVAHHLLGEIAAHIHCTAAGLRSHARFAIHSVEMTPEEVAQW